jgi:hypothetical protein
MSEIRTTGDISRVVSKLTALDRNLDTYVLDEVSDQSETLVNRIDKSILAKGLVGDPEDKPDQEPLLGSFESKSRSIDKWTVSSDAPHAAAIEEGASNHPIMPDGDKLLSFVPENPSDYPQASGDEYVPFGTWYDPEEGVVFSTGIEDHPGNKPYNYVRDAQFSWWPTASRKIDNSVKQAIIMAEFRPDIR